MLAFSTIKKWQMKHLSLNTCHFRKGFMTFSVSIVSTGLLGQGFTLLVVCPFDLLVKYAAFRDR